MIARRVSIPDPLLLDLTLTSGDKDIYRYRSVNKTRKRQ